MNFTGIEHIKLGDLKEFEPLLKMPLSKAINRAQELEAKFKIDFKDIKRICSLIQRLED